MYRFGVHLNALRAFEAAGRLSSISGAAKELHLSHSTVSHHVKGLEQSLGVQLFERRNRVVVLTDSGAALLPVLSESFDAIATGLNEVKPAASTKALRVTVTPSFANRWLIPNLRGFRAEHSDIDVQLTSSLALTDFRHEAVDIGIRCGAGSWPNVDAKLLMPIRMTPLCSPSFLKQHGPFKDAHCLQRMTLLHADVVKGQEIESEWRAWLQAAGVADADCSGGLSLHDPGLVLQAAVDGLGIAMGYVELAERDLASGHLVAPFAMQITHPWSYYTVTAAGKTENRQVSSFRNWIQKAASQYVQE